jgi:hypothetical protein
MERPNYVPEPIFSFISSLLLGDNLTPIGMIQNLAEIEDEIFAIEEKLKNNPKVDSSKARSELRKQLSKNIASRASLKIDVEMLKRLIYDNRMKAAYSLLTDESFSDQQWRAFIQSVWAARLDYSPYRAQIKSASILSRKISTASSKLAKLLRDTANTGYSSWPAEFFSVFELLRITENLDKYGSESTWRLHRDYLLGAWGNSDERKSNPREDSVNVTHGVKFVSFETEGDPKIDTEDARRFALRNAWSAAPGLPQILDTLSDAAKSFTPTEEGAIAAAIKSQKNNVKKEYIRALRSFLLDTHGLSITLKMKKAFGIVINVALSDLDIDVSDEDLKVLNTTTKK